MLARELELPHDRLREECVECVVDLVEMAYQDVRRACRDREVLAAREQQLDDSPAGSACFSHVSMTRSIACRPLIAEYGPTVVPRYQLQMWSRRRRTAGCRPGSTTHLGLPLHPN